MRTRDEIEKDDIKNYEMFHSHSDPALLAGNTRILEVLLDIRDLLANKKS